MSIVKQQKEILAQTRTIQFISAALRDVSAVQLKQLLSRYSDNTDYYDNLRSLCQTVWRIADREGHIAQTTQKGSLFVAYTTNRHFYGALNNDVMDVFLRQVGSADDVLVIGATGRSLWQKEGRRRKRVTFRTFSDDVPNRKEAAEFLHLADQYVHVFVVYPRFVSVYEQDVTTIDISYRSQDASGEGQVTDVALPEYVLEPDLGRVLAFFQTQVRHLLFDRLMLEVQLAQVSARLVRMDMADHNAQDMLKEARRSLRRAQAMFMNTRLLETTSGFIQWKQTNT